MTWLPTGWCGVSSSPMLGASAMPTLSLSTPVLRDDVLLTADDHDADAERRVVGRLVPARRGASPLPLTTLPAMVASPCGGSSSLSRLFGTMPARLCDHDRVHEEQVARRVRPRVPEFVVLGHDVGDHRVAGIALADVEAGVGAARRVRVVELPVLGVVRVDAVVAVAVHGEVRAAVTEHTVPEEPVLLVVAGGEVLHRHAVGARHEHAVLALELTVEDGGVAVDPTDHDAVGPDLDALLVDAGRHEHEVAGFRAVDTRLDRLGIGGDPDRAAGRLDVRRRRSPTTDRRRRCRRGVVTDRQGGRVGRWWECRAACSSRRRYPRRECVHVRLARCEVGAAVRPCRSRA